MVRILWRNGANNLSLTYLLFDFCGFVFPFSFCLLPSFVFLNGLMCYEV